MDFSLIIIKKSLPSLNDYKKIITTTIQYFIAQKIVKITANNTMDEKNITGWEENNKQGYN
jgi:hypothetical protein